MDRKDIKLVNHTKDIPESIGSDKWWTAGGIKVGQDTKAFHTQCRVRQSHGHVRSGQLVQFRSCHAETTTLGFIWVGLRGLFQRSVQIFKDTSGTEVGPRGAEVGRKWDGGGTEVGRKWDGSGSRTEAGRKRDGSRTEVGRERDGRGTEVGRKCPQKPFRTVLNSSGAVGEPF